jgi:hypothetical protein
MSDYIDNLRKIKSLLIVNSLQKKTDQEAYQLIEHFNWQLDWSYQELMIDQETWDYIVKTRKYAPKFIFCHPEMLKNHPVTSLYYRGLTGLSIKAAKDYFGVIERIEEGGEKVRLSEDKALKMSQVYNTFICSNIKGSTNWTLENGKRTIIATLGITLDGSMRNRVGDIAEERIRTMVVNCALENGLLVEPELDDPVDSVKYLPNVCSLKENVQMEFSSEPDISFYEVKASGKELLATIEIKGGTDPAGALERYGAATKSFQHALSQNNRCKNFFLAASITPELEKRIKEDRLVEKYFNIIDIMEEDKVRAEFFNELFHYTLRLA